LGVVGFSVCQIYGIDAASGAAVLALNVSPGDHVLDLCAAPGRCFFLYSFMFVSFKYKQISK